jgi:SanA protein
MVRARKVFGVSDAIIVSQRFHLPRALYLARHAGLDVQGFAADPGNGSRCRGAAVREHLAVVKAVWDVRTGSSPHFLGPAIPISGDPTASFDR